PQQPGISVFADWP
ncbi:MAG: hypothetical protein COS34_14355, partial [Lysobacterales bacterium CG02_land_8_20_14_3_00_62_12]